MPNEALVVLLLDLSGLDGLDDLGFGLCPGLPGLSFGRHNVRAKHRAK